MRRVFFTLFVVVTLGGCRLLDTAVINAEVAFSVPTLTFEPTYLGAERSLTVALENRGRAGVDVTLEVQAPFSLPEAAVHVAGGASIPVTVIFRPVAEGAVPGSLRIDNVDGIAPVELAARGLAPKVCVSSTCALSLIHI